MYYLEMIPLKSHDLYLVVLHKETIEAGNCTIKTIRITLSLFTSNLIN